MLHIVVLLVHLIHGLLKELVFFIVLRLDFKRCSGGPLSVLHLHTGLSCESHGHLGGSLLICNCALLPNRGHVLNDHIIAESVQICAVHHTEGRLVLLALADLLTDLAQLQSRDD